MNKLIRLNDWMVVRISGKDALNFLNGLTTRDLDKIEEEKAYLSAFLNPKGKISSLYWITKTRKDYAVGGFSILMFLPLEMKENAIKDLLKYNINVQIKLEDITQEVPPLLYLIEKPNLPVFENSNPFYFLPKGYFALLNTSSEDVSPFALIQKSSPELVPFSIFIGLNPLECGLKEIVELSKGCFLGQEPISRMTFRGRPRFQLVQTQLPTKRLKNDGGSIWFENLEIGKVVKYDDQLGIIFWQLRSRDIDNQIYNKIFQETSTSIIGEYLT